MEVEVLIDKESLLSKHIHSTVQEYRPLKRTRKPDFHSISHRLLSSHTMIVEVYPEDIRQ